MTDIICNGNFNNLDIGKDGGGVIVVRTFGRPEFNAGHTDNRFEGTCLRARDWHEFSLGFHQEATARSDAYDTPDVVYNFFGGREATYNQVATLLLNEFTMEQLGISESNGTLQKILAIDNFLSQPSNKEFLTPGLRQEVDNILKSQSEHGQHIFRFRESRNILRANSLADLVKIQLGNTDKYLCHCVLVLVGDEEVKHFLDTKGKELLGRIKPIKHAENHIGGYRKSIFRKVEDAVTKYRVLFPKSYKEINMGNEI